MDKEAILRKFENILGRIQEIREGQVNDIKVNLSSLEYLVTEYIKDCKREINPAQKKLLSDLDICNEARKLLGKDPLVTLIGNDREVYVSRTLYNHVRRKVLCAYNWDFARSIFIVKVKDVYSQPKHHSYESLTTQCLKIRGIQETDAWNIDSRREITVLGDRPNYLHVVGTRNEEDYTLFTELFTKAVIIELASVLCASHTNLQESAKKFHYEYESLMKYVRQNGERSPE